MVFSWFKGPECGGKKLHLLFHQKILPGNEVRLVMLWGDARRVGSQAWKDVAVRHGHYHPPLLQRCWLMKGTMEQITEPRMWWGECQGRNSFETRDLTFWVLKKNLLDYDGVWMCSWCPLGFPFLMAPYQTCSLLKPNEISLVGVVSLKFYHPQLLCPPAPTCKKAHDPH